MTTGGGVVELCPCATFLRLRIEALREAQCYALTVGDLGQAVELFHDLV